MPKPPSLNEIRANAARFALDWAHEGGREKQQDQDFMRDLLKVYGLSDRVAYWQYQAERLSRGRGGWIDALIPGQLGIEMKSSGENLERAEAQALDYKIPEEVAPTFMLTSDFQRFRLRDLRDGSVVEWALADFLDNAERLAFLAGYGVRTFGSAEQEAASITAAKIMGSLYEELEGSGYDDHSASVFLVRTLFALFADDAGMFPKDLYAEFIRTRTAPDGTDLGAQLTMLYQVLGQPEGKRQKNLDEMLARFPYVNGSIFDEPLPLPAFTATMRYRLEEACDFNWSAISPAVFGSLFQSVKSKEARRELGEHYTTETNILKVIAPMFLDDLNERVAAGWSDVRKLERIRKDMGDMRFLDPACGCGNFLVVAYRELRALDLRILLRLQDLDPGKYKQSMFFLAEQIPVKLSHFHGIEIEEWPARIAETALHLVEHQANSAMRSALGDGPDTLPLDKVRTITVANALRADWTQIVEPTDHLYVLGNPPFLGMISRTAEQIEDLDHVWGSQRHGSQDYVTGWHKKCLDLFSIDGYRGQFAFVSTNSITQGEPVAATFRPIFAAGWKIRFAHRTFVWTSEAANAAHVHCVIVGFSKRPVSPRLFDYRDHAGDPIALPVSSQINAYLVDGPNVLVDAAQRPLAPDLPEIINGNKPADGGHLLVEPEEYFDVAADAVAKRYLRPFVGARELVQGVPRWCLWMPDAVPADIDASRVLTSRFESVRDFRLASSLKATRDAAATPYRFWYVSHRDVPHVVIPRHVSETRSFFTAALVGPEVISGDANFTAEDLTGLAFSIVSSSMFIAWQRTVGGRIKSDLRFGKLPVWNTFPLPKLTEGQRDEVITGGRAVLDARALHPHRSLAQHYNPLAMDPVLLNAHAQLDKAVDGVFGLTGSVSESDRLAALFASYQRMITEGQITFAGARRRGRR